MVICFDRIDIQICDKYFPESKLSSPARFALAIAEAIGLIFVIGVLVFTGLFGAVVSLIAITIFIYLVIRVAFMRSRKK